jgi:hypothetical protein
LERGKVSQKRLDALALLREVAHRRQESTAPLHVHYDFEHTDAWEQVQRRWAEQVASTTDESGDELRELLEELSLRPSLCREVMSETLVYALALDAANRQGIRVDEQALRGELETFRAERGLSDRSAIDAWLARQGLDASALCALLEQSAAVKRVLPYYKSVAAGLIEEHLRVSGHYAELRERARAKHTLLIRHGLENPSLSEVGISAPELLQWFSERSGGGPVACSAAPDAVPSECSSFIHALLREYVFQHKTERLDRTKS